VNTTDPKTPVSPLVGQGQLWTHYKGTVYEVVGFAIRESDGAALVLYTELREPQLVPWARPLKEWLEVLPTGVRRFEIRR
jgi:hypothetical protein